MSTGDAGSGMASSVQERFAAGYLVVSANDVLQILFVLLPFSYSN